jgi:hypothetical protein
MASAPPSLAFTNMMGATTARLTLVESLECPDAATTSQKLLQWLPLMEEVPNIVQRHTLNA